MLKKINKKFKNGRVWFIYLYIKNHRNFNLETSKLIYYKLKFKNCINHYTIYFFKYVIMY